MILGAHAGHCVRNLHCLLSGTYVYALFYYQHVMVPEYTIGLPLSEHLLVLSRSCVSYPNRTYTTLIKHTFVSKML